ncbi:hypothetical protein ZEAMMB73_Zm00001d050667 [Zea mays]|uniref:Uncharacterized protein n=1 Tax=Zea mays TaxID=4577 RepID=A0A1D6Q2U4_MAIZE|nr:hypothetical protein ZEAMMB73_Zm00001d050667 [Zea mays]
MPRAYSLRSLRSSRAHPTSSLPALCTCPRPPRKPRARRPANPAPDALQTSRPRAANPTNHGATNLENPPASLCSRARSAILWSGWTLSWINLHISKEEHAQRASVRSW